jgi:hypothetical protein
MAAEREDFLTEDPEIPSQRWALLSFLSPEKVLSRKDTFFFTVFLKQYEFQMRTQSMEKFLVGKITNFNEQLDKQATEFEKADLSGAAALCRGAQMRVDGTLKDLQDFVKENQKDLVQSKLNDEFDDFLFKNKTKLEDEFYAQNNFQTTVRGLKIRGAYSDKKEAEMRAKKLQRSDPLHNIYVAEVGKWLPWDPSPHEVSEQEYAEDQLNTLMKKYKENEEARDAFQKEQRESRRPEKKKVFSDDGVPEDVGVTMKVENSLSGAPKEDAVPSLGTGASAFAGMFSSSGPADLAIERKLQNKE